MAYQLDELGVEGLSDALLERRIAELDDIARPRLRRLWAYYANPMRLCRVADGQGLSDRPYRQAQEWGLPPRITGVRSGREAFEGQAQPQLTRKEVVIENDIGWRIDTGVDYLFGREVGIESTAAGAERRAVITSLLRAVLEHNGGMGFLQQLALMGAVYGFVDVLVKVDLPADAAADDALTPNAGSGPSERPADGGLDDQTGAGAANWPLDAAIARIARRIRLEIVEPARALPFLDVRDWRRVMAYAQVYERALIDDGRRGARRAEAWWKRWVGSDVGRAEPPVQVVEIITAARWQRYEDGRLTEAGENSLGRIPLVHIQNTAMPMSYGGGSDVETLIPLQDELNTRLSDRASRITMQSFRMYLGKGIENFLEMPVGPGRMWMTDNPDAKVEEFGGDDAAPSESAHIQDLREAMDKVSSVTPIAAGAIKGRIGRLTSAAALRITLLALLSKTDKKRTTYGRGIAQMCELALAWLDRAGLFATLPEERAIELNWPSPLPENDSEKLQEAQMKVNLGVAKEVVLRELGY